MWPRRQERVSRLTQSPPRCAQLMGFASRGCLVIVLGATAERRNLFFRSDLGLPWIRSVSLRLSSKQQELGRAFDGHLADHHQFLCAQPTSTSRSRRVWPPFMW